MLVRCAVCFNTTQLHLLPCLHITCALCIRDLDDRGPGVLLACLDCNERFQPGDPVAYVSPADVAALSEGDDGDGCDGYVDHETAAAAAVAAAAWQAGWASATLQSREQKRPRQQQHAPQSLCAVHSSQPVTIFCCVCNELLCERCPMNLHAHTDPSDTSRDEQARRMMAFLQRTGESPLVKLTELNTVVTALGALSKKLEPRASEVVSAVDRLEQLLAALHRRLTPLLAEIDEVFSKHIRHLNFKGIVTFSPSSARAVSQVLAEADPMNGPMRSGSPLSSTQSRRFSIAGYGVRSSEATTSAKPSLHAPIGTPVDTTVASDVNDDNDDDTDDIVDAPASLPAKDPKKGWGLTRGVRWLVGSMRRLPLTLATTPSRPTIEVRTNVPYTHGPIQVDGTPLVIDLRGEVEHGERTVNYKPAKRSRVERRAMQQDRIRQIEAWVDDLRMMARRMLDSDIKTITLQIEGLKLVREQYLQAVTLCSVIQELMHQSTKVTALEQAFRLRLVVHSRVQYFLNLTAVLEPLVDDTLRLNRFLTSGADPMIAFLECLGRLERPRSLNVFRQIDRPSAIIEGSENLQSGTFRRPYAIACNPWGNLVVADYGADRIVVITPGGEPRQLIPFESPISVAVGDRGHIWVANTETGISCLSTEGQLLRRFDLPGVCRITIAPHNGDIILATIDMVMAITPEGVVRWRTTAADGSTYGLVCMPNGQLLTGSWRRHMRCALSLADGRVVEKIGEHVFPAPTEAAATSRFFVASNPVMHSVAVYTHQGNPVHMWGRLGSNPGEFNGPGSVAILLDDRIAVADVNNARIQLF